jgi:hypothetical protein
VTSNDKPSFDVPIEYADVENKSTAEVNQTIINNSWKRRFISTEFVKPCPFDNPNVNYNDLNTRDIAAQMFRNKFTKCISDYSGDKYWDIVEKYFTIYYDVALVDYASEDKDTDFDSIINECTDIVDESLAEMTEEFLMDQQKIHKLELGPVRNIPKRNIKNACPDPYEEEMLGSKGDDA